MVDLCSFGAISYLPHLPELIIPNGGLLDTWDRAQKDEIFLALKKACLGRLLCNAGQRLQSLRLACGIHSCPWLTIYGGAKNVQITAHDIFRPRFALRKMDLITSPRHLHLTDCACPERVRFWPEHCNLVRSSLFLLWNART